MKEADFGFWGEMRGHPSDIRTGRCFGLSVPPLWSLLQAKKCQHLCMIRGECSLTFILEIEINSDNVVSRVGITRDYYFVSLTKSFTSEETPPLLRLPRCCTSFKKCLCFVSFCTFPFIHSSLICMKSRGIIFFAGMSISIKLFDAS
jgi:hypothetical protein